MSELSLQTAVRTGRKKSKRRGRGDSSGRGTYSGRGIKGQRSRSGRSPRAGFEGGRMPLIQQLPKRRGFTSIHTAPAVVNLHDLHEAFNDGNSVTIVELKKKGLIPKRARAVKILGKGTLSKSLSVSVQHFSKTAKEHIEKAGGKATIARK